MSEINFLVIFFLCGHQKVNFPLNLVICNMCQLKSFKGKKTVSKSKFARHLPTEEVLERKLMKLAGP